LELVDRSELLARASLGAALVAVVLSACGRGDVSVAESSDRGSTAAAVTDLLVMRVPNAGGIIRIHSYLQPDSALWISVTKAPAVARFLGFDDENGAFAYVDSKGGLVRLELRSNRITAYRTPALRGIVSSDGSIVYGIAGDGVVHRLTPTGTWTYKNPRGVRELFPQPDGSLLISSDEGDSTHIWRLRPPESRLLDTTVIPRATRSVRTLVGDRLYFATSEGLIPVRSRDLMPIEPMELERKPRAIAPTPSGDRLYVLTDSSDALLVVDRYQERVERTIELPGVSLDLRMDPLGRYVLARSATDDSAWVIAVGTDQVVSSVATGWRTDLPLVAPDGRVVTLHGKDVVLIEPETRRIVRRIAGGASDFWYLFSWSGFRPRAAGLDVPVTFEGDSGGVDSTNIIRAEPGLDTGDFVPIAAETPKTPPPGDTAPHRSLYTVSFATMLQPETAAALAATIKVGGATARVVAANREGATIYRVVLGPYSSREQADQAGREAKKPFWVFEGNP
jgi:hypothetical protein